MALATVCPLNCPNYPAKDAAQVVTSLHGQGATCDRQTQTQAKRTHLIVKVKTHVEVSGGCGQNHGNHPINGAAYEISPYAEQLMRTAHKLTSLWRLLVLVLLSPLVKRLSGLFYAGFFCTFTLIF